MTLSTEQEQFITSALSGENVLVNACIGSGKTTAIQELCRRYPTDCNILYLTYNRLLKLDARSKIKQPNVTVQNYDGFAWQVLNDMGIRVGVNELIPCFLDVKPPIPQYDVLILDEYQDISEVIADELCYIKAKNPGIQIIAVGDLNQKIYDFTTLTNIKGFITELLDDPVEVSFTKCFRLPEQYADRLGKVWGTDIDGVNQNCTISTMTFPEAVQFLGEQDPGDVLVLGANAGGTRVRLQNIVERYFPKQYNKYTLWSSISTDGVRNSIQPEPGCAIFTTYDGSKGMERPILLLCDFDQSYWLMRSRMPQQKYEILRNIFLVAASRGKNRIIFVKPPETNGSWQKKAPEKPKDPMSLFQPFETNTKYRYPLNVSTCFDYMYREDVEACFNLLERKQIQPKGDVIEVKNADGMIDLSPCIGEYVEASYFRAYDVESQMKFLNKFKGSHQTVNPYDSLQRQILVLTAEETGQRRYLTEVKCPYVDTETTKRIHERLALRLSPNEEEQSEGAMSFMSGGNSLTLSGRCDVLRRKREVWELKFVSELSHTHFLQTALYMILFDVPLGVLWDVKTDELWTIRIKDAKKFLDQVARTITKRTYPSYQPDLRSLGVNYAEQYDWHWNRERKMQPKAKAKEKHRVSKEEFAAFAEKKPVSWLAKHYGVSKTTIRAWKKKWSLNGETYGRHKKAR